MKNVVDGLYHAIKTNQPIQMKAVTPWHYAAGKSDRRRSNSVARPVCPSKDMYCYFLNLTNCSPGADVYDGNLASRLEFFKDPGSWLLEYATRPQTWLRREVYQYSSKVNITEPCTAMHVRRADIVLHRKSARRYREIDEYMNVLSNGTRNIFLMTDDHNAIGEALHKYPEYNWMYIDRPRHRGA